MAPITPTWRHYTDGNDNWVRFKIREEEGNPSVKLMRRRSGDAIAEVIGKHGDFLWVREVGTEMPYTSKADKWVSHIPDPEPGDVWVSDGTKYRCIGVDTKRKIAQWVLRLQWYEGGYPTPGDRVPPVGGLLEVYTRAVPERYFKFHSREA